MFSYRTLGGTLETIYGILVSLLPPAAQRMIKYLLSKDCSTYGYDQIVHSRPLQSPYVALELACKVNGGVNRSQ
jgi:hypothetical protein